MANEAVTFLFLERYIYALADVFPPDKVLGKLRRNKLRIFNFFKTRIRTYSEASDKSPLSRPIAAQLIVNDYQMYLTWD